MQRNSPPISRVVWMIVDVAAVLMLGACTRVATQAPSVPAAPVVGEGAPVASLDPSIGWPDALKPVTHVPAPSEPGPVSSVSPIPVLMYHEIAAGPNNLWVPSGELAAHLEYLKQAGYTPITLQQAYNSFTQGTEFPPNPVVLTFDDGYDTFYTNAWPLLKQFQVSATLFVITGLVGQPGYVTWDQVRTLADAGIEMGAHTVTHPDLRFVNSEQLQREVSESRRVLREQTGQLVTAFAYPAGKYDDRVLAAVREAGYTVGVTTQPGAATPCQNRLQWKRIRINTGVSAQGLAALLKGAQTAAAREGACAGGNAPR